MPFVPGSSEFQALTIIHSITENPKAKTYLLKIPIAQNFMYLNTVPVSRIGPTWRWKSNKTMRKVDENIHQIPMPYRIRIRVSPSLDPPVISIATNHVMAHNHSRPIGQRQRRRRRLESNRGFVERVVKGLEVGSGLELFERLDWVRNWHSGLGRVERWRARSRELVL